MKTPRQIELLIKSEPGDIEAPNPNPVKPPVFEDVEDPNQHLSGYAADHKQQLDPQTRERALQRLATLTDVRVDRYGDRHFLLHRGVSPQGKFAATGESNYYHPTESSWSASYPHAHALATQILLGHHGDSLNPHDAIHQAHENVLSSWVPEYHITDFPSMHAPEGNNESNPEVVVKAHAMLPIASEEDRPAAQVAAMPLPAPKMEKSLAGTTPQHSKFSTTQNSVTGRVNKNNAIDNDRVSEESNNPLEKSGTPYQKFPEPNMRAMKEATEHNTITGRNAPDNTSGQARANQTQPSTQARANQTQPSTLAPKPEEIKSAKQQAHEEIDAFDQIAQKNRETVPNPEMTALKLNDQSRGLMSDVFYAAQREKPEFTKQMKSGLIYSVVHTPDKSKTYHFLTMPSHSSGEKWGKLEMHPEIVAGLEISHTPNDNTITNVYNRFQTHHNIPAIIKYATKYHKLKRLSIPEINAEKHAVEPFQGYNSDIVEGLRPTMTELSPGGASGSSVVSNREGTKKAIIKNPLDFDLINMIAGKKFGHEENMLYDPDANEQKKNRIDKFRKANTHWLDPNFTTSHREVAFDKMAREFFGLGDYLPPTAAFKHPVTGKVNSAQKWLEDLPHWADMEDLKEMKTLKKNNGSPLIQKIGLMDTILGNTDRHRQNYLVDKQGKPILIDHGLTFDLPNSPGLISGQEQVGNNPISQFVMKNPLSKETIDWVQSLDPGVMRDKLSQSGVPDDVADRAVYRLEKLKNLIEKEPNSSMAQHVGVLNSTGSRPSIEGMKEESSQNKTSKADESNPFGKDKLQQAFVPWSQKLPKTETVGLVERLKNIADNFRKK